MSDDINQSDEAENKLDEEDSKEIYTDAQTIDDTYPTSINVSKDDSSVYEIKRQYKGGRIDLSPTYQRGNIWSYKQKSELIESILMGIPLPLMYFFQNNDGVSQVVDGKQRLTTLFDYLDDKFALSNLKILTKLNKKKFDELEGINQGKLEDYKLAINIIKPPTPDRIKFDIFDRVNRGGTRLNNQEMRNAIYQGEATRLLDELKDFDNFKNATGNSIRTKAMKDRYMILRFIAFYLLQEKLLKTREGVLIQYKSDMDGLLGKTMEFLNFTDDVTRDIVKKSFQKAMGNAYKLLDKNGFRKSFYYDGNFEYWKTPVNIALFESLAYFFAKVDDFTSKNLIKNLVSSDKFNDSISTPVDNASKVNKRFEYINELLKGVNNDK